MAVYNGAIPFMRAYGWVGGLTWAQPGLIWASFGVGSMQDRFCRSQVRSCPQAWGVAAHLRPSTGDELRRELRGSTPKASLLCPIGISGHGKRELRPTGLAASSAAAAAAAKIVKPGIEGGVGRLEEGRLLRAQRFASSAPSSTATAAPPSAPASGWYLPPVPTLAHP
eukprot:165358-Chlamydomonas_euryale.AAC.7